MLGTCFELGVASREAAMIEVEVLGLQNISLEFETINEGAFILTAVDISNSVSGSGIGIDGLGTNSKDGE